MINKKSGSFFLRMAAIVVAMFFAATAKADNRFTIFFEHYVGERRLAFDTANYSNEQGQAYVVTKFKYYIGKIQLVKSDGGLIEFPDYYLVNEEAELSKQVSLIVPAGSYTGINFKIGVDSLDNCSGAQAGALDPVNAMFWTWNNGYIFLKLEGKSPVSKSPGGMFEFHIGGYKSPANCIRTVTLKFKTPVHSGSGEVHIKADVAEVLKTPTTIDFSKLSSVTISKNASIIADNYMDMFSVLSVKE
jgi:hypothetical protein